MRKYIHLFILLIFSSSIYGQKNIRLNITQLRLNGLSTGCDLVGNEEPRWYFTNNRNGNDWCVEKSTNSSGNLTWAQDNDVFNQNYICLSDIPSTIGVRMRACENDGVACWIGSSCDGGGHDHTDNFSTTTTNGTYTTGFGLGEIWYTDDHGGCGNADYGYTIRMIVSGSWQTTKNQDASGNITNATCSTPKSISPALPSNGSWRGPVRADIKRCGDTYYSFTLSQDVDYLEVDMFNQDGEVDMYFGTDCSCPLSNDAGLFDYDFKVNNARAGTYIIKLRGGGDYVDVDIRTGNGVSRPANDNYCGATNLSSSFSWNSADLNASINTDNASGEDICTTNEPDASSEKTVWWKFTTSSTPPARITINPSASGLCTGQARVYSGAASGSCSGNVFTNYAAVPNNFNGLTLIDYTNFGNDFYINCPSPNTTYYIMGKVGGVCSSGSLSLSVKSNGAPKFGNDLCSGAIDLGTLPAGGTRGDAAGTNRWNNFCAGTAGDPNPNWTLLGVSTDPYQTVWFKFTTAADGSSGRKIRIDGYNDPGNYGDQIDLKLALYSGSCGSMTLIDKDYDTPPYSETMEDAYCLMPNTTYHILVSGSNFEPITGSTREGFFGLTVQDLGPYPVNDLVCNATTINVQTQYTYNSHTLNNQTNVKGTYCFEPNPDWTGELGRDNDAGVWYYIGQVPGRTMVVDANSLSGDNIDLQLALYSSTVAKGTCTTPSTTPALTERQKEYNITSWDEDAYFNCLNPNLYYWIMVDGSDATGTGIASALEEGTFSLRVWFPEEGEITGCAAENLGTIPTGGSLSIKNLSNICGASSIANFPAPSSFSFDKAVVYRFTTPAAPGFTDASIKIEATTNPYYDQATYNGPGGGPGGNMGTFAGDDIDLQLAVYSDGACSSPHFVVGSNYDPTDIDVTSGGSDESVIVNCLKPSTEYYLVVDGGPLNTNGYFDLKLSDYGRHTTNNYLCNAIDITGTYSAPWTNCNSNTTVTLTGQNNYCANTNNDFPSSFAGNGGRPPGWNEVNGPVWYKFKAPKSGKLEIRAKNTISDLIPPYDEPEISLQLAVFFLPGSSALTCPTGTNPHKENLIFIASDYDGLSHDEDFTVECLMADSIYYLAVDGTSASLCPGCDRGEFYLELQADPRDRSAQNDSICHAIDLGTPSVWTNPQIYDTRVSPASNSATYPSPTSGYPSATGLHNGARNNASSCMRVENNFCAGIGGEPAVSGGNFFTDFSPDGTVWYKFTAPSTGEVKINTYSDPDNRGDLIYTQIAVFETSDNTCTGTMVGIAADGIPDNLNGDNELIVKCLDPGKTYFLMVDGAGVNKRGYFELQIQAVPATQTGPANNAICNATSVTYPATIGATTTLNNQTNRCATKQSGVYPDPTTFSTDADVWYTFTTPNTAAPHAVEVTVTSGLPWPFGDAMDPQVALYKRVGTCPSATFELVDDQYSAAGLPFYERMEFHCLEQNTTYYLMVDGSGLNEQGNFKLDVKRITPNPLAANDNICAVGGTFASGNLGTLGATLGNKVGNTSTNWHNFCSTVETNEASLMTDNNYSLDQTVWFKFRTPNVANNIDVEIRALNDPNNVGDQIDLQMLLVQGNPTCPFSASTFSTLSPIESVDPLLTFNATMNVCLPPNTDFYIQVDGSGLNKQGYFTIEVENKGTATAPANDNICNAKTLPSSGVITGAYTGYLNDNNNCATLEANERQQTPGSVQRSVWYKFVAPASADVSIEVKGNSAIPFTQNYFLPDVTIWELNDGTFASPETTISSGCPTAPPLAQWNKLVYTDAQSIPNSLANGFYPTVELTPLCLKPGYTYYVQVDGVAGIGLDGYFDIRIKNNQATYTGPSNNEASGAITVPLSTASCQYSNGTWQSASGYSFGVNPTWSNPSLIGISSPSALPSCTQNCGDVWYKFQMPAACGNNTKSFVKIEGDDEFNLDINGYPELAIAAYVGPSNGSTSNLTYLKCNVGGVGVDPDFSISANPGEWIYLQIWDLQGDEQSKTFKLCVSEQKSADDCVDATVMTLDVPYCFSVESHTGENPNPAVPGSGLNTCFGSGTPQHSSYFKFTTDAANNFCDDYYIYIKTDALAKQLPSGANNACISGTQASVSFNMSLWELKSGGTPCTPGVSNVLLEDCITFDDCGGGSFGANVVGPHGNGGVVNDTIYYNLSTGEELKPNTTYYIVLDYKIDNPLYESRVVLDGIIEVGRRCKGRVWEYTTAPLVTTSNYCVTRDGWQHYYDDKGTPATADDKYIFSVFPNGNNIKGTAKVYLNNTYYSYPAPSIGYAEYVMRRRWDFVMTPGFNTIDPAKPVKVRFYYQTNEKTEIENAAITFRNTYGGFYEDFEWFKSANGHEFDVVADVNPKVISVGPNGYSETGCLSYWDANGVYIGAPGVARCSTITAIDWEDNNTYQSCNGIHYVEYSGITGFSGGTGGTGVSPWDVSPLPVELVSFTGYNSGNINVLNWVTASEINTHKFYVERSKDAVLFDVIGEKDAAGHSTQTLSYSLNDVAPYAGNNYYRLKVVDLDGTYNYSNIILIKTESSDISYTDAILNVFPNPTNHTLFIDYVSSNISEVEIKVYDAIGQVVLINSVETVKGNQRLWLDVRDLSDGVYIINIQDKTGGNILQTKFVKE